MYASKRTLLLSLLTIFGYCGHFTFAKTGQSPAVYDPNYWIKPRISAGDGIVVVRGATQTIIPEHRTRNPYATIIKFNNSDIQIVDRRSSDLGKTWHKVDSKIAKLFSGSAYQYPGVNGEVVTFASGLKKTEEKGVYKAEFARSKDNGLTRTKETTIVKLPEEFDRYSTSLCRKIVLAQDGNLLTSIYSYEMLDDGKGGKIYRKARTSVIRSEDRGKSWDFLATVASELRTDQIVHIYAEQVGLPALRIFGFEEPCLLVHPKGKVFCFMRTGTNYRMSLSNFNMQSPVYMSISNDSGRNWSNADAVAPFGVWPDALVLKNGIMVVGYGRPGNWLMFSKDEGKSWGPIFQFYNDLYPPDGGNYIAMAEIADNTLLVAYVRTNPNDNRLNTIAGTYFFVNPQRN